MLRNWSWQGLPISKAPSVIPLGDCFLLLSCSSSNVGQPLLYFLLMSWLHLHRHFLQSSSHRHCPDSESRLIHLGSCCPRMSTQLRSWGCSKDDAIIGYLVLTPSSCSFHVHLISLLSGWFSLFSLHFENSKSGRLQNLVDREDKELQALRSPLNCPCLHACQPRLRRYCTRGDIHHIACQGVKFVLRLLMIWKTRQHHRRKYTMLYKYREFLPILYKSVSRSSMYYPDSVGKWGYPCLTPMHRQYDFIMCVTFELY